MANNAPFSSDSVYNLNHRIQAFQKRPKEWAEENDINNAVMWDIDGIPANIHSHPDRSHFVSHVIKKELLEANLKNLHQALPNDNRRRTFEFPIFGSEHFTLATVNTIGQKFEGLTYYDPLSNASGLKDESYYFTQEELKLLANRLQIPEFQMGVGFGEQKNSYDCGLNVASRILHQARGHEIPITDAQKALADIDLHGHGDSKALRDAFINRLREVAGLELTNAPAVHAYGQASGSGVTPPPPTSAPVEKKPQLQQGEEPKIFEALVEPDNKTSSHAQPASAAESKPAAESKKVKTDNTESKPDTHSTATPKTKQNTHTALLTAFHNRKIKRVVNHATSENALYQPSKTNKRDFFTLDDDQTQGQQESQDGLSAESPIEMLNTLAQVYYDYYRLHHTEDSNDDNAREFAQQKAIARLDPLPGLTG